MQFVDEKFKDASPVDTVNRIKDILAANGLFVTENWFDSKVNNCYSLRVTVDGTKFGTNGKGVTKELANASAHAELMERLQSGIIDREELTYTDEKWMDFQELLTNCSDFLSRICKVIKQFDHIDFSPEELAMRCLDLEGGKEKTLALPFYNISEDKMVYVPKQLILPLFSSTGNCAGNTAQEAIVQGISEIVERWFQRHFLCLDLVPPTIPEEYLCQYTRAYNTISDIRSKGYDVIVKDCSMGSGYPVIATAVIDKRNHTYHVHLGASPIFEIALGRSLTETFQGRTIDAVADTRLTESAKNDLKTYRKSYAVGRGAYSINFFTENSSFPFVPFPDRTQLDNAQLLRYAVDFIKDRNMSIYIRDMSHLGFHSYKIIIPDMCKSDFDILTSSLPIARLIGDTKEAELDLQNATIDQLFELQMLNRYKMNSYLIDSDPRCQKLLAMPIAEDGLLDRAAGYCHLAYVEWECGNEDAAMGYAKSAQRQEVPPISDYFSCLIQAKTMLKEEYSIESIIEKLNIFYKEETVNEVAETLRNNLNPFRRYVVRCSRDQGCQNCCYQEGCKVAAHRSLIRLVNSHIQNFDRDQSFTNIKKLFV